MTKKKPSIVDFPEEVTEANGIMVKVYGETSYENFQPENIKNVIYEIGGQKVMLDYDLATIKSTGRWRGTCRGFNKHT